MNRQDLIRNFESEGAGWRDAALAIAMIKSRNEILDVAKLIAEFASSKSSSSYLIDCLQYTYQDAKSSDESKERMNGCRRMRTVATSLFDVESAHSMAHALEAFYYESKTASAGAVARALFSVKKMSSEKFFELKSICLQKIKG